MGFEHDTILTECHRIGNQILQNILSLSIQRRFVHWKRALFDMIKLTHVLQEPVCLSWKVNGTLSTKNHIQSNWNADRMNSWRRIPTGSITFFPVVFVRRRHRDPSDEAKTPSIFLLFLSTLVVLRQYLTVIARRSIFFERFFLQILWTVLTSIVKQEGTTFLKWLKFTPAWGWCSLD